MQYLALIYSAADAGPQPGTPEFGALMGAYQAAGEKFKADGVFVAGDALEGTDSATTLRKRNDKLGMTDGPFAETKEHLGGYYIFDCKNLDDAIRYASMIPTAEYGTIEVRPVIDMN